MDSVASSFTSTAKKSNLPSVSVSFNSKAPAVVSSTTVASVSVIASALLRLLQLLLRRLLQMLWQSHWCLGGKCRTECSVLSLHLIFLSLSLPSFPSACSAALVAARHVLRLPTRLCPFGTYVVSFSQYSPLNLIDRLGSWIGYASSSSPHSRALFSLLLNFRLSHLPFSLSLS